MRSTIRKPWGRLLVGAMTTLLLGALPFAGTAAAAPPPAQSTATFCQNVPPTNPFTDVSDSNTHKANILCLAYSQITTGKTQDTYAPTEVVRRDQMASFVARLIDKANELETGNDNLKDLPPYSGVNQFTDVPNNGTHTANINRLADAGVVKGTNATTYNPAAPVTRAQMASFINRAQEYLTGTPFSTNQDYFTDDNGNTHEANINAIASVGIAQGVNATQYAPNLGVTRAQMASFLIRHLAVNEAAGAITPLPAGSQPTTPDLTAASANDVDKSGDLSQGDTLTLVFANPVKLSSSITLTDADNDVLTLTDDATVPTTSEQLATFALSQDGKTVTITAGQAAPGTPKIDKSVDITDASGITDADTNEEWVPSDDDSADTQFDFPAKAAGNTGTVTATDTNNDTYDFVADGASTATTVHYKSTDNFTVNGNAASMSLFEQHLSVGDQITYTDDTSATNKDTHALTDKSGSDITAGMVGNVDTAAHTLYIIEPATGVAISDVKNYAGGIYFVDNAPASQSTFEGALNEGDTISINSQTQTYQLTNKPVTGNVSSVNTGTDLVKIGVLGDDPVGPQNDSFNYALAGTTYTIDGATATMAQFEAALSVGDNLTYQRTGGVQTFALTNQAPASSTGTVTEAIDTTNNTVAIVNGAQRTTVNYANASATCPANPAGRRFLIGTTEHTESEWEADLSTGDTLSFTPDDPATAANECTLTITNPTPDPSATGSVTGIDTTNSTYDIVNAQGGLIWDNVNFNPAPGSYPSTASNLYFVKNCNSTATCAAASEQPLTFPQFMQYMTKIKAAQAAHQADASKPAPFADIKVQSTNPASTEHHLMTDQTLP
jgi:hypothetical protein